MIHRTITPFVPRARSRVHRSPARSLLLSDRAVAYNNKLAATLSVFYESRFQVNPSSFKSTNRHCSHFVVRLFFSITGNILKTVALVASCVMSTITSLYNPIGSPVKRSLESAALPYATREAFLTHGVDEILLDTAVDCSICREPLLVALGEAKRAPAITPTPAVANILQVSVHDETVAACNNEANWQHHSSSTKTASNDVFVPESAVCVLPCQHIFRRTCLRAWFESSKANRCPECDQELFPLRYMRLSLREPTLSIRLNFASYIEEMCGDSDTAEEIRADPMSDWTRSLIREFTLEVLRQEGYDVEYQYVEGGAAEDKADDDDEDMTDEDGVEFDGMEIDVGDEEEDRPKEHGCP